ncbi:MAG TPA: glycogen synthase GlgA [Planctomycetota bacterium]|nr:glycogen synthase GlgA [Planctomycetota bacterium]
MNIAYVSSEVAPYSKSGGLADVSGALPTELAKLGHSVNVFTPYYRAAKKVDPRARQVAQGLVPVGEEMVAWTLHAASANTGARDKAQVYFIGCDQYFDREGLYGTSKGDYEDSCQRFVLFCRACLAAVQSLAWSVDVWHCHDWQAALIPVYLKLLFSKHPLLSGAASVFTIHNLAYQGLFWHWGWPVLNLPWKHYNWKELEFHGKMNLLKGALIYSDMLTTVSPTYAEEIQTVEHGCGLEGVLKERAADLTGIVNGIDAHDWNPATDTLLPAVYNPANLEGKSVCKAALRRRLNLPENDSAVVGIIGRLFEQKGFDLVAQSLDDILRRDLQLVILGTGREEFHRLLQEFQTTRPEKVAVSFAFDNGLAHLIEAGSDIFLMPSRYEPCGLNQLYSLKYGTPPVVHRVGGLADTVTDTNDDTLARGSATGFQFESYGVRELLEALDRALVLWKTTPDTWRKIQLTGMAQDWTWPVSAKKYVEVFKGALRKMKSSL